LVDNKTFSKLSLMYKITSYKEVTDNKILVSYVPRLYFDVINSHKLAKKSRKANYLILRKQPIIKFLTVVL